MKWSSRFSLGVALGSVLVALIAASIRRGVSK